MESGGPTDAPAGDDANEIFMYCIRCNDLPAAVKLLESSAIDVNYRNQSGNTAVHFACANDLPEAVAFLLRELRADYVVYNDCGNSPLHWAVQNKALGAVGALLAHDCAVHCSDEAYRGYVIPDEHSEAYGRGPRLSAATAHKYAQDNGTDCRYAARNTIDILRKNAFGRDVLGELYNAEDMALLELVLGHPIAAVLDGPEAPEGGDSDPDGANGADNDTPFQQNSQLGAENGPLGDASGPLQSIVHEFAFGDGAVRVSIRETAVGNGNILDASGNRDRTGLVVWESAVIAAHWLTALANAREFGGKRVLELGAGCGLPGIALWAAGAHYGAMPSRVVLSDAADATIANLKHNVAINNADIEVIRLSWQDDNVAAPGGPYDAVIGSDLVYDAALAAPLAATVARLLKGGGRFLYVFNTRRDGADFFVDALRATGLSVTVAEAPRAFQKVPLADKPESYSLTFFPDIASDGFFLLTAERAPAQVRSHV